MEWTNVCFVFNLEILSNLDLMLPNLLVHSMFPDLSTQIFWFYVSFHEQPPRWSLQAVIFISDQPVFALTNS